ncbi:MAG: hypothetical protein JJ911_12690 [Rhizobiaceae bacterium]|nr:hypothetical protein [Rhizobiaceae bacterium]
MTDETDSEEATEDGLHGSDIHHDPWLVPASEPLADIATSIFEQIEHNSPQSSRRRTDARERRRGIVDNLVANLALLVLFHPTGSRLAISAKNTAATRYDRPAFSREVVMRMVSELASLGFVLRQRGVKGQGRTTIEPTLLLRSAMVLDNERSHLGRANGAETIILKASSGRGRPKVLVNYEDTLETVSMRRDMEVINKILSHADLRLGPSVVPPPFLTRRFQIEHKEAPQAFDRHGRLYGGFWMSLPKDQRHRLRIGGEEVVDLDFASMFYQLARLEAGLALPDRDPYEDIEGLPRSAAKLALSALLCRAGPMMRLPAELRQLLTRDWSAERLAQALSERHSGIAHLFGTGIGLRLMFTESRILVAALLRLANDDIPALPMHDGMMVAASKEGAARMAMAAASNEIVGIGLPVRRKEILKPAFFQ